MPATLTARPTTRQRRAASSRGLVIDSPKRGKGERSPLVWYWSVRGHERSWLGSWVPGTTWWWTYCPMRPGNRGQSNDFAAVLAVFVAARRVWLDTHGFQSEG